MSLFPLLHLAVRRGNRSRDWTGGTIVALFLLLCPLQAARAENWALLIGIDEYDDRNRITSLGAAARDARALKRTLVEVLKFPDDNVELLVSDGDAKPTRTAILNGLSRLARNAKQGDTVFVLFSGHGIEIEGKPYLLPYDTSALDDSTITDTALETGKFDQRLHQVKARLLVLAFDMCRSDPRKKKIKEVVSNGSGNADNRLTHGLTRGADFGVPTSAVPGGTRVVRLFSCSEGERSYEWQGKNRGYFSYFLEQGLRGAAADAQGRVTVAGLTTYLENLVPDTVAKRENGAHQTPYPTLMGPGVRDIVLATTIPPPKDTNAYLTITTTNATDAVVTVDGQQVSLGSAFVLNLVDVAEKIAKVKATAKGFSDVDQSMRLVPGERVNLLLALVTSGPSPASRRVPSPGSGAIAASAAFVSRLIADAQHTAQSISDGFSKTTVLCSIAVAQAKSGDVTGAQASLESALKIAQGFKNDLSKIDALRSIAAAQARLGDMTGAQASLESALKTAQSIQDSTEH